MTDPLPNPLRDKIRAAISNAYYDARNTGKTMEHGADQAADDVMEILSELRDNDESPPQEHTGLDGSKFIVLPDGTLMRRPSTAGMLSVVAEDE